MWKTLSTKILHKTAWLRLVEDKVIHPSGKEGVYTYLDAIDGVVVIAEKGDGNLLVISEYKYPPQFMIKHFITGGIHEGQAELDVARQELFEESGYEADEWIKLGKFFHAPGIETTYSFVYLAKNIRAVKGKINNDGDEMIGKKQFLTRLEINDLVVKGEFNESLSLAALQLYDTYISRK